MLAVVVSGAAWLLSFKKEAGQVDRALTSAQQVLEAAESWKSENADSSGCPTLSQLEHERFLREGASTEDPWGSRLRIHCDDDGLAVISPGPDGRAGTNDDVRVPRAKSRS